MVDLKTEKTVIFLHIQKTAGTTLRTVIERLYETSAIYSIYPYNKNYPDIDVFKKLSDSEKSKIKIICGHISFGVHESMPQECTYITVLRNTVDRVVSFYSHITRDGQEDDEQLLSYRTTAKQNNMSLSDFVASGIAYQTDNHQTRILSNMNPSVGECTPDMLEEAKKNLREHFAVVGLTERFDESVMLMKKVFGWKTPFYLTTNVSQNRPSVDEEDIKVIEEHNKLDIELYNYASELLDEQIKNHGPSFEKEVEDFRAAQGFVREWLIQIDALNRQVNEKEQIVNALHNSMSWRVTAPMRTLARLITRQKR
jgi:hypothetical protein